MTDLIDNGGGCGMVSIVKYWRIDMNLGWLNIPGFRYDYSLEGYDPATRTFGGRAGPSVDDFNLLHEVSHGIVCALDDELWRLDEYGYGLRIRQVELYGQYYNEPLTGQATNLECRVMGIQKVLMDDLGVVFDLEGYSGYHGYCAKVLDLMPDWIIYGKHKRDHRRKRHTGYRGLNASRHRRLMKLIYRYECAAMEDYDSLRVAWNRVCEYNKGVMQ